MKQSINILMMVVMIQMCGSGLAKDMAQISVETDNNRYAFDMSLSDAEARMREVATLIAPRVYLLWAPLTSGPATLANEVLIEQADGLILVDSGKRWRVGARVVGFNQYFVSGVGFTYEELRKRTHPK